MININLIMNHRYVPIALIAHIFATGWIVDLKKKHL